MQGAMPREAGFKQNLCADVQGFSLHAAVRCGADDRKSLEQLCRYIRKQWDGRPHPQRHQRAKVEALINHLNREGRPS